MTHEIGPWDTDGWVLGLSGLGENSTNTMGSTTRYNSYKGDAWLGRVVGDTSFSEVDGDFDGGGGDNGGVVDVVHI
jgi:hypothetical protein